MRQRHGPTSRLAAGVCLASAIVSNAAAQRQTQYRTTDLGNLRFIPNPDEIGTFGINNKGEVAFGLIPEGQTEIQAAIWLPEAAYGYGQGVTLLAPPAGYSLPSILRDVNVDGQFVGQVGGVFEDEGEGIIYNLGPAEDPTLLGFLPGAAWSRAHAITDGPDPIVVGESEWFTVCPDVCGEGGSEPKFWFTRSFWATLTGGTPTLNALDALGCDPSSLARDVSKASGLRIAGLSGSRLGPDGGCDPFAPTCPLLGEDAVAWTPTLQVLTDLDQGPVMYDSQSHGVNSAGQLVGWAVPPEEEDCNPDALFWDTFLAIPFNLGTRMPGNQQGAPSRAEAINNLPEPQVVGWNEDLEHALIWENQGALDNWIGKDLNEVAGCADVTLNQALDINDDGWIVAWGSVTGPGGFERHAYLLTPLGDCPADITGNGVVDQQDFLQIVAWWGDCPTGVICKGDINGDCVVNIQDFLRWLGSQGPCPGSGGQNAPGGEDASDAVFFEALQSLGFADLAAYQAWAVEADEAEVLVSVELLATLIQGN
jgi:hypothetical protein